VSIAPIIPVLLAIRVVLDLASLKGGRTSYRLELAYFALFAAAGATLLAGRPDEALWGWLSVVVAAYSLIAFFVRRSRYRDHAARSEA